MNDAFNPKSKTARKMKRKEWIQYPGMHFPEPVMKQYFGRSNCWLYREAFSLWWYFGQIKIQFRPWFHVYHLSRPYWFERRRIMRTFYHYWRNRNESSL